VTVLPSVTFSDHLCTDNITGIYSINSTAQLTVIQPNCKLQSINCEIASANANIFTSYYQYAITICDRM